MKHFESAYFGSFSLLNAVGAAAALRERKFGLAVLRLVLSCLMAGYAANAAAHELEGEGLRAILEEEAR